MKRIFLKTFIILGIFIILTSDARADWFNLGNPISITDKILSYLGFDIAEIRNSAKYFNVARRKKDVPSVDLTFSPTNPSIGEKITVTASAINFVGTPEQLYFTWYIRHNNGAAASTDSEGRKTKNGNTDWDEDGDIGIEDYKIEAMRIIANGGFDWEKAERDGLYSAAYDPDGPLSGKYESIFGGESQRGKYEDIEPHCFYHDFDSGDTYEFDECIHLFPNAPDEITAEKEDSEFTMDEKRFWHTSPLMPDTAGSGFSDEANVAGLGATQLSWNYQPGDEIGVAVEGAATETTIEYDTTYKVMWALPKNRCDIDGILTEYTPGLQDPITSTTTTTTDPVTGNVTTVVTEYYEYAIIDSINFIATVTTTPIITTTVRDPDGVIISGPTIVDSNGASVTKPITYNNSNGENENTGTAYDATGRALPNTTETIDMLSIDPEDMNDCLLSNLVNPGEGSNTKKIEVSLSYSPETPHNDPADITPDILNVTAAVSNSKNTALKYTWEVYKGNEINPEKWGDPIPKAELPEVGRTSGVGLSSLKFKLAFPDTASDPTPKYLRVKVTVNEQLPDVSATKASGDVTGEGIADIIIPLASTNDQIHVYPTEADEDLKLSLLKDDERCNTEMDKVVCPVVKNEIVGMQVSNPGGEDFLNILWTIDGKPIRPVDSDKCLSNKDCVEETGDATDTAYFPVLKENGERYTINFTAINSQTNEKINLTRIFEVVDPDISIVSADENTCRPELLGHYLDLDGTSWPDYSDTSYQSVIGSNISLKPVFNMSFVDDKQWYINGVAIDSTTATLFGASIDDSDVLTFPINKLAGEIYSVVYSATYTQNINIKKILNTFYDIQLNEFYEKQLSAAIEITVVDSFNVVSAKKMTPKKILAAIIADVPAYLNFLFRIVLTAGLFLFVSRVILALFSKTD